MEEKRLYPRLNLRIEDGYFGLFILPNQEHLMAPIVNLSAGGLNMALAGKSGGKINPGDFLLLRNIVGGANLAFLSDIKSDVRWVKKLESSPYLSVGCRFLELTGELRRQLMRFVDTERSARGQYAAAEHSVGS